MPVKFQDDVKDEDEEMQGLKRFAHVDSVALTRKKKAVESLQEEEGALAAVDVGLDSGRCLAARSELDLWVVAGEGMR
eukprot:CAMPEP_0197625786 /NCGR_PEP_ID=MMETSP1338-20131121/5053_1 /TAXON_ID=43686 ORGANISM="Pelagodinium beii, Strain RCC1491" /NCGR_SAMPLE_ID=MMETSP1338 /ASSEMBLY_ACC=CAM_ASM_000754 /LENGTH=77 /DNA_ID=CAMNT_0043196273 /DNA_START=144 /DNA_END=375 /DNA_ORIENTATION=+